jgi:hypothetical protein
VEDIQRINYVPHPGPTLLIEIAHICQLLCNGAFARAFALALPVCKYLNLGHAKVIFRLVEIM